MLHVSFLATRAFCLSLVALGLLTAAATRADEIVVNGNPMSGKVVKITPKGLDVETTYGKGNVLVDYKDVTTLRTDEPFTVLSNDEDEIVGKLVGVKDGQLLVGEDEASAKAVAIDSLHDSVTQKEFEESGLLRLRSTLRYWDAHYDLSFAATDATTNTLSFATGFEVERRKRPTRFLTMGSYRVATIDDPNDDPSGNTTTENELIGAVRGEYDLTSRIYAFAAASAEYDEIESLSIRFTPKAGPGYRIIDTETQKWSVDVGGAWVLEEFFGGDDNSYASIAFGTEGSFTLPWKTALTMRGSYLPAVDDWAKNYLLRGEAALMFPMTDWLSFRTGVVNTYTSQPAEDTDNNSLTGTAGLALVF
jgi:hypothetical protein